MHKELATKLNGNNITMIRKIIVHIDLYIDNNQI